MVDPQAVRARAKDSAAAEAIIAHHTTPREAAGVFARVTPRLAVYSHASNLERIVEETRQFYSGRLQGASDMLTIEIGREVIVEPFTP